MRPLALSLAALALLLPAAAPALAEETVKEEDWARSRGFRLGVEADVLVSTIEANLPRREAASGGGTSAGGEASSFAASFAAVAQIPLFAGLHLDAELPFAYGSSQARPPDSAVGDAATVAPELEGFFFGNPSIGLHYVASVFPTLMVIGGLSASIPVTQDPSDDTAAAAAAALAVRGYFDAQRTLLEHVPLRARGGVELRPIEAFYVRSDLVAMFAIPTADGETEVFIEHASEAELRSLGGFGVGARLQAAFPLTRTDKVVLAAEPFVGVEPPTSGLYFRAGLLVALDEPLGFGLEQGKLATVRVALGGKF
ncbi:hypothetical protein BE20_24090 [Sorangium cellulosum]|uniref:Secreted protein n=1 Tax=Sorangium cellulosum TaxID=56 RepID=A0A150S7F6_SORCE|nr:hypothetical protein BE18_20645 [Sorangium cellulosum]KYF88058.1 hypothetical protein BE20_24090 [Sorangium cellulosum]